MTDQEKKAVILDQFKTDYINRKSVGVNIMVERHGFDKDLTSEVMNEFTEWGMEREKRKKKEAGDE